MSYSISCEGNRNYTVSVTYFELYGGRIFDLLNHKRQLTLLEDKNQNANVVGLKELPSKTPEDMLKAIHAGSRLRSSRTTSANSESSRSHAVFSILLKSKDKTISKLTLVDLAGSERAADTIAANRQARIEG